MSARRKHTFVTVAGLSALGVAGGIFVFLLGAGATQEASPTLGDFGLFRVGSALGEERAGFSGLPKAIAFVDPSSPDWPGFRACLTDPAIEAELVYFTPVAIDVTDPAEAAAEPWLREDGLRAQGFVVVLRHLNGKFLGGIQLGASCDELLAKLRSARESLFHPPKPSALYSTLLEHPEIVDTMVAEGNRARAEKCLELLREFEGEDSPVVQNVAARLGR
jgi:hypothetical protein